MPAHLNSAARAGKCEGTALKPVSETSNSLPWQWPLLAALVAGIVLIVPRYLEMVAAFGHDIAQSDMQTDYLKGLLWALFLGGTIFFWPVSAHSKRCLLHGWLAKIVVTLGFMLFYENHYGVSGSLDGYMYFDESRQGDFSFSGFDLTHGTDNLVNLTRLHHLLLPDSYHAMKVSFAMVGLLGIYLFYRAAVLFLQREDRRIFYLLCFFPGILFWSSILGKDPLVFFGIACYSYGVVGWYCRRWYRFLIAVALGIVVAICIRQWLGIIMLLPLGILLLNGVRGVATKAVFAAFIVAALLFSAGPFMQRFKIEAISDLLSVADRTTKGFVSTGGGSAQQLDVDFTSAGSLATFLPSAAFTALFRPIPGEVLNPFGLLAGSENALLLTLLWLALWRSSLKDLKEPLVQWALSFLVVWSLLNGIVSSTNFGVAVRYKLQVLPILLGVLMYLSRRRVGKSTPEPRRSTLKPHALEAQASPHPEGEG